MTATACPVPPALPIVPTLGNPMGMNEYLLDIFVMRLKLCTNE